MAIAHIQHIFPRTGGPCCVSLSEPVDLGPFCVQTCVPRRDVQGRGRATTGRFRSGRASRAPGPLSGGRPRAREPAPGVHPRPRPRGRPGPGGRPRHRAGRLGHDHPPRPADPARAEPAAEGARWRDRGARQRALRARLPGQVDPAGAGEGVDRGGRRGARPPGNGHRHFRRDDHLRLRPRSSRTCPT